MPGAIADGGRVLDAIRTARVVAILRAQDSERFRDTTRALIDGGVRIIEFTLTSAGALNALNACSKEELSEVILGAGSVINADGAMAAIDAGAAFLVTPTFAVDVIRIGTEHRVPVIAGGFTPTELESAWEAGASVVKLFPAYLGGPAYLRAVLEPLPHLPIMPTGGISAGDVPKYLAAGAIAVGVGGYLVGDSAESGDLASVTQRAKDLMSRVRD